MLDLKKYQKISKDIQQGIEKLHDEMDTITVEGVAGGGAVKVSVNGNQEIVSVAIKPEAVDPDDIQMLEDLFRAAANQAIEKSKELQQQSLNKITGGMKIPNLPFM
jgi:DNA-binding YbaB/EbfC family protein